MSGMGNPATLPLRDVHMPPAPSWWPPAPGWWLVAGAITAIVVVAFALYLRRRRRRLALARLFDDTVARADTPAARVAAISELLRRAARRVEPAADTLAGDEWLRFLDRGTQATRFQAGPGALLRDGAFRPDVDERKVDALRVLARERFLAWMARR